MKLNWLKDHLWIIAMALIILAAAYLQFFHCGGLDGTVADVPRWCWWLR